jgi:hypothetical protein
MEMSVRDPKLTVIAQFGEELIKFVEEHEDPDRAAEVITELEYKLSNSDVKKLIAGVITIEELEEYYEL